MGKGQRFDIQFLRGCAVLLVIAYHAFPSAAQRGFLGVDLFFVLSGFLMTKMIVGRLDAGDFSFVGFYLRRARRLLPAAFTTFAVTACVSWWLMTADEWNDFTKLLLGSVTFTANYAAKAQAGYFDGGGDSRPLMHIWSLSIEEQFYFLFPLVLWAAPAKRRFAYLAAFTAISLGLCFYLASGVPSQRDAAFYGLPSRSWELLAGALCAMTTISIPKPAKIAALGAIAAAALIGFDNTHPRFDALLVVAATSVILLGKDDWLPRRALKPIARVGDWSYSLYLIHWPLLSFGYLLYAGQRPWPVTLGICILSLVLAATQYRFVEQPWRRAWPSHRAWVALAVAPAVMACAPIAQRPTVATEPVAGLADVCDVRGGKPWFDQPRCRTSDHPEIAVWGDSYAMALMPGVVHAAGDRSVIQMTRSACVPILGASYTTFGLNAVWSRNCVRFNQSVIEAIEARPSIRYVVIVSAWRAVLSPERQRLLVDGNEQRWSADAGYSHLLATLARIRKGGRIPIVVGPTPAFAGDPVSCQHRKDEGLLVLVRCSSVPAPDFASMQLRKLSGAVLMPRDILCSPNDCATWALRDSGHLNARGAVLVTDRLHLAEAF